MSNDFDIANKPSSNIKLAYNRVFDPQDSLLEKAEKILNGHPSFLLTAQKYVLSHIKEKGESARALELLGDIYYKRAHKSRDGNIRIYVFPKAVAAFKKALELGPNSSTKVKLIRAYLDGVEGGGLEYYTAAMKLLSRLQPALAAEFKAYKSPLLIAQKALEDKAYLRARAYAQLVIKNAGTGSLSDEQAQARLVWADAARLDRPDLIISTKALNYYREALDQGPLNTGGAELLSKLAQQCLILAKLFDYPEGFSKSGEYKKQAEAYQSRAKKAKP